MGAIQFGTDGWRAVIAEDFTFTNLDRVAQATADYWQANPVPSEMRTHFHVPVFLEELGPFRTTRFGVQEALKMHRESPLSDHLEIETYTWDVLPPELKTGDIIEYVSRELEFVRNELIG